MTVRAKSSFSFMAHRKNFWLLSVVIVSLGLIANILMGVRPDVRVTGGTVLRYSFPESGIVSAADVPVSVVPAVVSDTEVQNIPSVPAQVPVIISGADVSGSDLQEPPVSEGDTSQEVSGSQISDSDAVSGSDTVSASDIPGLENIEPDYSTAVVPAEAERLIMDVLGEHAVVQLSTDPAAPSGGENRRLTVTFDRYLDTGEESDRVFREAMSRKYPNVTLTLRETSSVDPVVGSEFVGRCVVTISLAVLFMVLYIGVRYRSIGGWTAALSAIVAILHDCLVTYFSFVLFRFPINDNFIAVVLAVIGLSLNSTIVIFDRVRENRTLLGDCMPLAKLADRSINESIGRTVSTDLCVFIAVAVLAVTAAISGLTAVLSFAVPLMFGVACGCYSSLCIACTVWVSWQELLERRRAGERQ
ncbi:MAG: hypothetical protein E7554_02930 [Ruminococcaceae bacterium]|nr:hypothetical protein [Oscillospiraceae bacterium]